MGYATNEVLKPIRDNIREKLRAYDRNIVDLEALLKKMTYTPHEKQKMIEETPVKIRVVCCGRRWGKTVMAYNILVKKCFEKETNVCWWVSPTHRQSKRVYRLVKKDFKQLIEHRLDSELRIEFKNGAIAEFHSGDNADNLRGEGLNFVVMDEAAMIKEDVWNECIEPMLLDKNGDAIIISTPKGRNWFYYSFLKGQKDSDRFISWQFPTSTSPFINNDELYRLKQEVPELSYKQEYEAEFVDDASAVFIGWKNCISGQLENPDRNLKYIVGVDLARKVDFSVIIVMETRTRKVVYFDRFNKIDWKYQKERIVNVAKLYNNAKVIMDSTGVGDPIYEMLVDERLHVEGIQFTTRKKKELIERLSVDIEHGNIAFPYIEVLINEIQAFSYEIGNTGEIKYNAPDGFHDDSVIALALANIGCPYLERKNISGYLRVGKNERTKIFEGY